MIRDFCFANVDNFLLEQGIMRCAHSPVLFFTIDRD